MLSTIVLALPLAAFLGLSVLADAAPVLTADADFDQLAQLLSQGLTTKNLWLIIPPAVWIVVKILRLVADKIPALNWFTTRLGTLVLGSVVALVLALLQTVLSGTVITLPTVIAILIKAGIGLIGAVGLQETPKNAMQHFRGEPKAPPKDDLDAANVVAGLK